MNVTLRAARSTDAGATGDILHRFEMDTPWMPKQHSGAEAIAFCGAMIDKGWVTVAECDGTVQAFLARNGEDVLSLFVAPGAAGKGLGPLLLQAAKAQSKVLRLWTFQANTGAQRFYQREGFVETGRSEGADNDEKLPGILYVWTKETGT